MNKPVLVIMAAGMGSRYGGLKQMDPVGPDGELILDYSLFDAKRAGFERAVIIIKKENEQDFRDVLGDRVSKHMQIDYAYQALDNIPEGFDIPEGRVKPWGTGHAVLCAADKIEGAFAVINADDFYGRTAFKTACDFLTGGYAENEHAMVAYRVENTLTENGSVSRGVCAVEDGLLTGVVERTTIVPREGGAAYIEGDQETFLPAGTPVSMNLWAFQHSVLDELKNRFSKYLDENLPVNPMKCEYFLPLIPNALIQEKTGKLPVVLRRRPGSRRNPEGVQHRQCAG